MHLFKWKSLPVLLLLLMAMTIVTIFSFSSYYKEITEADNILVSFTNNNNMSSQIDHLVSLFNGSDYCSWAMSMTAFLRSQHLWGIVSGRETWPSDLSARAAVAATTTSPAQLAIPAPTPEQVSERQREQREWMEKDKQAQGIIQLRLTHNC